jgi:hypothetical protein
MYEQALAEFQEAKRLSRNTLHPGRAGPLLRRDGTPKRSAWGAGRAGGAFPRRHVKSLDIAFVHLGLGDKEEALRGLERASTEGEGWVSYFNADPVYDPLRSDPRFQSLLARVGARGLSREKGQ